MRARFSALERLVYLYRRKELEAGISRRGRARTCQNSWIFQIFHPPQKCSKQTRRLVIRDQFWAPATPAPFWASEGHPKRARFWDPASLPEIWASLAEVWASPAEVSGPPWLRSEAPPRHLGNRVRARFSALERLISIIYGAPILSLPNDST